MTTTAPPDTTDTGDGRTQGAIAATRAFAWTLIVTGAAGLLASWVITVDKIRLMQAELAGETYTPGCSFNPIVACQNVMQSEQAEAFGFPNPILGLVTYAVVVTIGVGALAGARYQRWFWLGLQGGTLFGVGFCTWLMYQSLYNINSLCLWCTLAWVATLWMFWLTLTHNLRHRIIPAPEGLRSLLLEFPWVLPVLHTGLIGMLILLRWWDFWIS
ncbi:vitamin K epoxide reductase family protein [Streptomyces durbertensis]|uniref:Vitamin K epoxide reductase family protein n=1 Tax=Streptomyces durbertensis TaxID=2448886 RepID=A0ABR6EGK0_9ACTN|nr:vitamin K epoxide reductase family protein [Streptomyces durbertensis]MBB1244288.1 vitamin K epoxide reductase family protein [Streptomyces durbertensis]